MALSLWSPYSERENIARAGCEVGGNTEERSKKRVFPGSLRDAGMQGGKALTVVGDESRYTTLSGFSPSS
jgi:hypothetical protein